MVVGNDLLATMIDPKQGGVYFLSIDEIVARKGWSTYKEMIHDDQVKACLEFKKILVAGRTWELQPGDDTPDAQKQAKFIEEVFRRIDVSDVLHNALSAFEFGYSLAEQVFERDIWDANIGGDDKQYVFMKKLQHRDPRDLVLKMDYHGNFIGAKQWGVAGVPKGVVELTPDKLWLFSHDKRFGNLYGNSDLRAAYRSWFAKKFVIQFWNVFLERFGAPMTKMTYPLGASDDLKAKLKTILSNLASKTEILVPEGVDIALVEATRGGNSNGYTEALSYHNNAIARAMLMSGIFGIDGDTNRQSEGNGQSFIQLRILFKMADNISQKLAASLMDQVVKPLLDLNFDNPVYPNFIWQDYGQFEGMQVADEIRQLFVAGLIDPDQQDINYVRSIIGLPIRDEEDNPDEVIRPQPMPPPGGNGAAPPAPQGNDRGAGKTGKQSGPSQTRTPKGGTNNA